MMFQQLLNMSYNFNTPGHGNGYLNSPPSSNSASDEKLLYPSAALQSLRRSQASEEKPASKRSLSTNIPNYDSFFYKQIAADPQHQRQRFALQKAQQQQQQQHHHHHHQHQHQHQHQQQLQANQDFFLSDDSVSDLSGINSLDEINLNDFETAYNMLTRLQAQYVQSQIEQLKQMQEQNMLLQKSRPGVNDAKVNGYQTGSLFSKNGKRALPSQETLEQGVNDEVFSAFVSHYNSVPRNNNSTDVREHSESSVPVQVSAQKNSQMLQDIQAVGTSLLSFNNELLSENENNALQGFLDDFLVEPDEEKDELDELISGLNYNHSGGIAEPFRAVNYAQNNGQAHSHEPSVSSTSDHVYVRDGHMDSTRTPRLESNSPKSVSPKTGSATSFKQYSGSLSPKPTRTRRTRKKLLSEEEKRNNHTSSEKKRRLLIKTSFDTLVNKLPLEDFKRQNDASGKRAKSSSSKISKFVVLDSACNQIDKLLDLNKELQKLCLSNGISTSLLTSAPAA